MKHKTLMKWCQKRRGRAAALANYLGKSREFVRQMANATRPIPGDLQILIPAAIKQIELDEGGRLNLAMRRIIAIGEGT